jgi:hypothetical protein
MVQIEDPNIAAQEKGKATFLPMLEPGKWMLTGTDKKIPPLLTPSQFD